MVSIRTGEKKHFSDFEHGKDGRQWETAGRIKSQVAVFCPSVRVKTAKRNVKSTADYLHDTQTLTFFGGNYLCANVYFGVDVFQRCRRFTSEHFHLAIVPGGFEVFLMLFFLLCQRKQDKCQVIRILFNKNSYIKKKEEKFKIHKLLAKWNN